VTAITSSPTDRAAPVTAALNLGWQLTEIAFQGEPCRGRQPPERPDLPTLSDLQRWELTQIGVTTVVAELHHLALTWTDAGLDPPSAKPLREASLGADEGQLRQASQALHYQLLERLHAADFTLGEAYDLGRALAYTTLKPHDTPTLREQFAFFRLQTLQGWLADLATALPAHAARPVAISLDLWQHMIPDPAGEETENVSHATVVTTTPSPPHLLTADIPAELSRRLHRQGKLWREVLTGEKSGQDMLATHNYIEAGIDLLRDTGRLIRAFFSKPAVTAATALLVGLPATAVVLLLVFDHQAASQVTGSVLALAAGLGITWTGLRSTLGKALARAEQPLWQTELDTAIAEAITVLPADDTSLRQLFNFAAGGSTAPPAKRPTASEVAAERLPRGPDWA